MFESGLGKLTAHTSTSFLAVTNHDRHMEDWNEEEWSAFLKSQVRTDNAVRDLVADSVERKNCMCSLWEKRSATRQLTIVDIVGWLQRKPLLNECTHYSCVMDPGLPGGGLLWVMTYDEPVDMNVLTEFDH